MFLLFRKAKRMVEYPTTMAKICDYIAKMPASCYYLADSTAYRYVCKRIKGEKPKFGKYQAMKENSSKPSIRISCASVRWNNTRNTTPSILCMCA